MRYIYTYIFIRMYVSTHIYDMIYIHITHTHIYKEFTTPPKGQK